MVLPHPQTFIICHPITFMSFPPPSNGLPLSSVSHRLFIFMFVLPPLSSLLYPSVIYGPGQTCVAPSLVLPLLFCPSLSKAPSLNSSLHYPLRLSLYHLYLPLLSNPVSLTLTLTSAVSPFSIFSLLLSYLSSAFSSFLFFLLSPPFVSFFPLFPLLYLHLYCTDFTGSVYGRYLPLLPKATLTIKNSFEHFTLKHYYK